MVTPCDLLRPVRMAKLVHMCLKRISETVSEADVGLYVQIPTWSWRTAGPTSSLKLTLPDQSSTISVPFQSVTTQRQISRWSFCKNNTFFTWIAFTFPKLWFICVCVFTSLCVLAGSTGIVSSTVASRVLRARPTSCHTHIFNISVPLTFYSTDGVSGKVKMTLGFILSLPPTLTMGTYSSGAAGWILLDISITALTNPVTFSYTLSFERSRLAVGGGLISWGCSWVGREWKY